MRMKRLPFVGVTALVLLGATLSWFPTQRQSVSANQLPATAAQQEKKPSVDWQDDPVCQMVFFAVLEGLYTDGVQSDVVDSLVPKTTKANESSLKANFVAQCPLCHPVYEALSLYQRRSAFMSSKGKRDTLGKGIDPELRKQLTSTDRMARLEALRVLVRTWVDRKIKSLRLTEAEQVAMQKQLMERASEGKTRLISLMKDDPSYQDGWSPYWGCAACNGTTDACVRPLNGDAH